MAVNSGVLALVEGVRSYFTARGVTANVSLGWKQPTKQINQGPGRANRVVFIPSDPNGRGGKIGAVEQPGARTFGGDTAARALYTWERFLVVSVWAVDTTDPHDEALQIEAVEDLFEQTVRAVHAFAKNNGRWGDVTWTTSPAEHAFGRELRASLVFKHPLFDSEYGVAYPAPAITKKLLGESG
jgi:hypothetical protein